jgi:hypothetical protein
MEVTMRRQIKKLVFGAIFLVLFGLLIGQVVSAKETKIVFGVA